jgi:hypothetical protein
VSAVFISISPPIIMLFLGSLLDSIETVLDSQRALVTLGLVKAVCGLLHLISRLRLVVLIFYCFCSMPEGVYQTVSVSWTGYIPHFS